MSNSRTFPHSIHRKPVRWLAVVFWAGYAVLVIAAAAIVVYAVTRSAR